MGLGRRTRKENVVAKRSLVVVESPTKVKKIQKYLDSSFVVKASMGHVRDLPKSQLGVDPKKGFKPKYVVSPGKKKVLDELKKAAANADTLYVATDPDREGEAIGWHLAQEVDGEKVSLADGDATRALMAALQDARFIVKSVTRGERRRNPVPPFITSTLQQEAGRKLGFTAKKTMAVAQQLYEGIDLGAEGAKGLITYMRTDSVRVAREAQAEAREWITARLGLEYVPEAPPGYRSRGSAQEAHEAIRPSEVRLEPSSVARFLTRHQVALYRLVWERFLASQMMPAVYDTVTADIEAGRCLFRAQGATLRFKGFTAVYEESREDEPRPVEDDPESAVPQLEEGEALRLLALGPSQP